MLLSWILLCWISCDVKYTLLFIGSLIMEYMPDFGDDRENQINEEEYKLWELECLLKEINSDLRLLGDSKCT